MTTKRKTARFDEYLHRKLEDPQFRREYEALGPRFDLAAALIRLRLDAGLTQEQLAARIGTKQSYVTRIEGKPANLTLKTLARLAGAFDADVEITFKRHGGRPPLKVAIPARRLLAEGLLDRFE